MRTKEEIIIENLKKRCPELYKLNDVVIKAPGLPREGWRAIEDAMDEWHKEQQDNWIYDHDENGKLIKRYLSAEEEKRVHELMDQYRKKTLAKDSSFFTTSHRYEGNKLIGEFKTKQEDGTWKTEIITCDTASLKEP